MRLNGLYVFVISLVLSLSLVTSLSVDFVSPTPNNGSTVNTKNVTIVANITTDGNEGLDSIILNVNNTSYSLFDASVILYYNFDNRSDLGENDTHVKDISNYANNGTITNVNNAKIISDGYSYKAINFNGSNGLINVTGQITKNNSISTCFWSYRINKGGGDFGRILDNNKYIISYADTNQLQVVINGVTLVTTNGLYTTNNWIHTCITTNISGYTSIYTNGNLSKNGNTNYTNFTGANNLYIGNRQAMDRGWNGTIDELIIMNKTLNESDVIKIYNAKIIKFNNNNYTINLTLTINLNNNIYYLCVFNKTLSSNCTINNTIRQLNNIISNFINGLGKIRDNYYGTQGYSYGFSSNGLISTDYSCTADDSSNYIEVRNKFLNSGYNNIRWDLLMSNLNESGHFEGNSTREIIEWAFNNNKKVLLTVKETPTYNQNRTTGYCTSTDWTTCSPVNYTRYGYDLVNVINNITNNGLYIDVIEIELGNEFYGSSWLNNLSYDNITKSYEYIKFYNASYTALKDTYPNIKVGGGNAYMYNAPNMINTFLSNLTNRWDFISIHQYIQYGSSSQSVINQINNLILNCSVYSANCSTIYLTEWNLLHDLGNVFTDKHKITIANTYSYLLNNLPSNTTSYIFKFTNRYKNESCESTYNYTLYDSINNLYYPPYNITKQFATYHPSGATVYSSSSDYDAVKVVSSRTPAGNRYITIINTDTDSVNLTINTNDPSIKITRTDTNEVFRNTSYGEFNIGVLNSYDVITYELESREICSQTDASSYSLIMIACALAIVVFIIVYVNKKGFEDLTPGDFVIMSIGLIVALVMISAIGDNLQSICYFT